MKGLMTLLWLVALTSALSHEEEVALIKKIDISMAAVRGTIQGLKRGFYQEYTYEIKPNCFGESTEVLLYKFFEIIEYEIWSRLYEIPGYVYELWLVADQECQLEESIYDLIVICDTHVCSLEKVVENEIGAVFQITSVLNSVLAIYYIKSEEIPDNLLHDEYFDMYSELGTNIGKLLRYSFDFDPKGGDDVYDFDHYD
jgi:hypothetical protein